MKNSILIGSLFLCSLSHASGTAYDLKMDLSLDGKHIASPRVIMKAGQVASIIHDSSAGEKIYLEIVAAEKPTLMLSYCPKR